MTFPNLDPKLARYLFAVAIAFTTSITIAQDAAAPAAPSEPAESTSEVDPGQADLDEAVIKRISAESVEELEAVAAILESALKKGLNGENEAFAKKMLGSVLLQRGQGMFAQMARSRGGRRLKLQEDTLLVLEEAVTHDPTLVEAFMLIARINILPGGDKAAITEATTKAIELLDEEPEDQSAAYLLRALTRESNKEKLEDLDAAIKVWPENFDAIQARAGIRLEDGDVEGALKDLESVLEKDPTNEAFAEVAVAKLSELNRLDDAKNLVTKALEAKPTEGMYRLRAHLSMVQGKTDDAMSDLNKAIAMKPKDPITLLQRALVAVDRSDLKAAKEDLRSAIQLAPQIANADRTISLRAYIAAQENRMADAINDMRVLVDRSPNEPSYRLRLARMYSLDNRPRKAIEVLSEALDADPQNVSLLRSRGDARLSVGEHPAAISDYESALRAIGNIDKVKADPSQISEAAGLYNNLSWVLATSPTDSVRDGKKALEYGLKAAELSEYKEPHILSTLAAAHAENGDFEKAIEWSTKCVEMGRSEDHEQQEQLEQELESYKAGKPWREKTETEENTIPILSPEDLIDT